MKRVLPDEQLTIGLLGRGHVNCRRDTVRSRAVIGTGFFPVAARGECKVVRPHRAATLGGAAQGGVKKMFVEYFLHIAPEMPIL